MEFDEMAKGVMLLGILWIGYSMLFGTGNIEPKMGGETCIHNEECINQVCTKEPSKTIGYCKLSSENGKCIEDKNCETGLACKKDKCVKLSSWCQYKELADFFILFGALVLVLEYFGFRVGKIIYKDWEFIGAVIGIIALAFGLWVKFLVLC